MIDLGLAGSRPLATAARLVRKPVSEDVLFSRTVVLTGDADALATRNGRLCLLYSLRLLLRIAGRVIIQLPQERVALNADVAEVLSKCDFRGLASQDAGGRVPADAWCVLCVGRSSESDARWTHIGANGWVTAVGPLQAVEDLDEMGRYNPATCLFSASVGAADVFRRLIEIPVEFAPPLSSQKFSLHALSAEFEDFGPVLPEVISLPPTLQVGAGAIGNGLALMIPDLNLRGRWHIVDKQTYGDENLGTCVLLEREGWIGAPKAVKLAEWLRPSTDLNVTGEQSLVKDALGGEYVSTLRPKTLLNGLDDVQARHDAQLAWPDRLIDGGIGDVGAAVFQWRHDERNLACLRCGFQVRQGVHKTAEELTGLRPEAVAMPDEVIGDTHLALAPGHLRDWLAARKGKTVCSVLSEAALAQMGVDSAQAFRPSVPFVATASAALMMGELLKAVLTPEREYVQQFTFGNLFLGPQHSAALTRAASAACICVSGRAAINAWRAKQS
jgi:hypothetical protein